MCNLGEALVRETARENRQQGRLEGMKEGNQEAWTMATTSLMQAQSCSIDDAFLTLHVPLAYQEAVRKALSAES